MLRPKSFVVWGLLVAALVPLSLGLLCQSAAPDDTGTTDIGQPVPVVLDAVATATPSPATGGQVVILDASGSVGPAGSTLTFAWAQTAGTPVVTLTNAASAQSGFIAPALTAASTLTFTVTVSDGTDTKTASVDVVIAKTDRAPVANAGPDQLVDSNNTVTLDGSASSDPDQDPITYSWVQTTGTSVTLDGGSGAHPTFIAPPAADRLTLTFELTISDGVLKATDQVIVTVSAGKQQFPPSSPPDVSPLAVLPDDLLWLVGLRNVQGLFDAVDGLAANPGAVEDLLKEFMTNANMGDVNLPDLNGALAIFQLKPLVVDTATPTDASPVVPTAGLPCVLFQLSPAQIEGVLVQVFQQLYANAPLTIAAQEIPLTDALAGVTRADIVATPILPADWVGPTPTSMPLFTFWYIPLGGSQFTVVTAIPALGFGMPADDIAGQWPLAGDLKRIIDWQGQSIEQRFDAKWVTSFKAGHALAWAEGDFVFNAVDGVLDNIIPGILPGDAKNLSAAGNTMAQLIGQLPLAVAFPKQLVEQGNPAGLDDVCLVVKVAEPGVGQLWARFEEGSVPQQYLATLPTTGDSMLIGLPDEPIFGAFGMIGPWVDNVLDLIDDGDTNEQGAALNAVKPLVKVVKDAAEGQTLMMAGSVSELPAIEVPTTQPVQGVVQVPPVTCGPKVGATLVVTGPGVGDPTSASDVITRIENQIDDHNPDWVRYGDGLVETVNGQPVVWLMMSSKAILDDETVPYPLDDLWNGLFECDGGGTLQMIKSGDMPTFQWDILARVVRVDANHVVFCIDPLSDEHAMTRLTGIFNLVAAGQAPLADRPLVKNARATLADNRTAEAYLATWPDTKVEYSIINGQFLKFQYDLAIAGGGTPPVATDPGDAAKAMGLSFGNYNDGKIAELYISIPIEDLLKAVLTPKQPAP